MGRKLGRNTNSRKALFRGLARSLFEQGGIITTEAKAKAARSQIDKLITLAKKDTLVSRRRVLAKLGNDTKTLGKILDTWIPAFEKRNSGFTKLVHMPARVGDSAKMVKLELSDKPIAPKPKAVEKTAKRVAKKS